MSVLIDVQNRLDILFLGSGEALLWALRMVGGCRQRRGDALKRHGWMSLGGGGMAMRSRCHGRTGSHRRCLSERVTGCVLVKPPKPESKDGGGWEELRGLQTHCKGADPPRGSHGSGPCPAQTVAFACNPGSLWACGEDQPPGRAEPQEGAGPTGGEAGAPSTGTSSGPEGPRWGARFCSRKVPFQAQGRACPAVSAQTPTAWRTGTGVGAPDLRRPGGQVPTELTLHRKEFLPGGSVGIAYPPPAPRNEVPYPPGHLAILSAPTPSPTPAPSLIPCFPGWLAGGSSFCGLFWMDSDVLREAEITRPEFRPLA